MRTGFFEISRAVASGEEGTPAGAVDDTLAAIIDGGRETLNPKP